MAVHPLRARAPGVRRAEGRILPDPAYQAFLPGSYDVALRDVGLPVSAVVPGRLAVRYAPRRGRAGTRS
jgi:hypothetical protein